MLFYFLFCFFFLLFFSCCSYSLIYTNLFHMSIYLCFSIFSFNPFSHPFLFSFLSLLFYPLHSLFSPCTLICYVSSAIFPSWHSALAEFSGLSVKLALFLTGQYHFGFLCSPSQSLILPLEYFGYVCVCVYVSHCYSNYLPDPVFSIYLGLSFISCYVLLLVLVCLF